MEDVLKKLNSLNLKGNTTKANLVALGFSNADANWIIETVKNEKAKQQAQKKRVRNVNNLAKNFEKMKPPKKTKTENPRK